MMKSWWKLLVAALPGALLGGIIGGMCGYYFGAYQHEQEMRAKQGFLMHYLVSELGRIPDTMDKYNVGKVFYRDPIHITSIERITDGMTTEYRPNAELMGLLLDMQVVISTYNEKVRVTNLAQTTVKDMPDSIHNQIYQDTKTHFMRIVNGKHRLLGALRLLTQMQVKSDDHALHHRDIVDGSLILATLLALWWSGWSLRLSRQSFDRMLDAEERRLPEFEFLEWADQTTPEDTTQWRLYIQVRNKSHKGVPRELAQCCIPRVRFYEHGTGAIIADRSVTTTDLGWKGNPLPVDAARVLDPSLLHEYFRHTVGTRPAQEIFFGEKHSGERRLRIADPWARYLDPPPEDRLDYIERERFGMEITVTDEATGREGTGYYRVEITGDGLSGIMVAKLDNPWW